jgi:hypothetical protein
VIGSARPNIRAGRPDLRTTPATRVTVSGRFACWDLEADSIHPGSERRTWRLDLNCGTIQLKTSSSQLPFVDSQPAQLVELTQRICRIRVGRCEQEVNTSSEIDATSFIELKSGQLDLNRVGACPLALQPPRRSLRAGAFCTRRSDIHEEASVKTGARRSRDYPDIHSASSAKAERHERVCGCSHSHQRRRNAPCRTPGCNLSPALDLDVNPLNHLFAYVIINPGEAAIGYLAKARFSSQTVPRFSMAHITRTR